MGRQTYQLDAKNRIFIPAKHREPLGPTFVVFPNIKNPNSVIASTVEYYQKLKESIKTNEELEIEDREEMVRYMSEEGDVLTPDAQGRVVIPASLVALADLGGPTVIVGHTDFVELMAEKYYTPASDRREHFKAVAAKKIML